MAMEDGKREAMKEPQGVPTAGGGRRGLRKWLRSWKRINKVALGLLVFGLLASVSCLIAYNDSPIFLWGDWSKASDDDRWKQIREIDENIELIAIVLGFVPLILGLKIFTVGLFLRLDKRPFLKKVFPSKKANLVVSLLLVFGGVAWICFALFRALEVLSAGDPPPYNLLRGFDIFLISTGNVCSIGSLGVLYLAAGFLYWGLKRLPGIVSRAAKVTKERVTTALRPPDRVEVRLQRLERLKAKGLISEEEYRAKREEILWDV